MNVSLIYFDALFDCSYPKFSSRTKDYTVNELTSSNLSVELQQFSKDLKLYLFILKTDDGAPQSFGYLIMGKV